MGILGLAPLTPIESQIINTEPKINTDLTINTQNSWQLRCSTILSNATTMSEADFMKKYARTTTNPTQANDMVKNITTFHTQLTDPAIDATQTITSTNYPAIDSYLTSVTNIVQPVVNLATSCLMEANDGIASAKYQKSKENLDESKERLEFLQTPEENVSYYEGWFPLFRPMKPVMMFIIFGVGLVLFILSILLFLQLGGVEINIRMPSTGGFNMSLNPYMKYIIGGIVAGCIVGYGISKIYR